MNTIIIKKNITHLVLYFPLLITLSAFSGITQNQFTHISARENRFGNGNGTMLDNPDINNNPKAILFVTQKEQGLNPHPIGVYYFKGRWNIMNLDLGAMPEGAEFFVEYFINPDKDHFQYLIKKENIRLKDGSAFIDHQALNNHPDAQFNVFHSWVPEAKEYGNSAEVQTHYDPGAGKWVLSIVSNLVNKSLPVSSAYNINIISAGKSTTTTTTPVNTTPVNTNPVNTNPNQPSNTNSFTGPPIKIFMTVWVNGIKLPGENLIQGHFDQIELLGFDMGVATARELGSGRSTGRRQYEPVTFKSTMGYPAEILLFDALINSKSITLTLDFFSNSPTGNGIMGLNYSVKLTGVTIAGFKQIYENGNITLNSNPKTSYNEFKFMFTKIEFISPGAMAIDTF